MRDRCRRKSAICRWREVKIEEMVDGLCSGGIKDCARTMCSTEVNGGENPCLEGHWRSRRRRQMHYRSCLSSPPPPLTLSLPRPILVRIIELSISKETLKNFYCLLHSFNRNNNILQLDSIFVFDDCKFVTCIIRTGWATTQHNLNTHIKNNNCLPPSRTIIS